jgi:hypothetical protein
MIVRDCSAYQKQKNIEMIDTQSDIQIVHSVTDK